MDEIGNVKRRGNYKKYLRNSRDSVNWSILPKSTKCDYKKRLSSDANGIPYASYNYIPQMTSTFGAVDSVQTFDTSPCATDLKSKGATGSTSESDPTFGNLSNMEMQDDINQPETFHDVSYSEQAEQEDTEMEDRLFPGCRLNKLEAVVLIFAFAMRHKMSNMGIEDILTLINMFLPEGSSVPKSVYLLEKLLGADYSSATRHYYCGKCDILLEGHSKLCPHCCSRPCNLRQHALCGETTICRVCGSENKNPVNGKFFVIFDITKSLDHVLRRPVVTASILKKFEQRKVFSDTLRDVTDGRRYQQLNLHGHNISCCVNTDGASLFKSTTFSLWPLLFSINELDYPLRRKHTILGGIWWGVGKPNFDLFLTPVVKIVQDLSVRKVRWHFFPTAVPSKVVFPIFATDAVAKCMFQGMTQFNGEFGGPWCLIRGDGLRNDDGTFKKWIYDPRLQVERRSNEGYRENVRELCESLTKGRMKKESVCGVTNASQLLLFTSLDIINGNVFDFMHSGMLGVLKTLTTAFFETHNHEKPYYLGRSKDLINKRIALCKLPSDCSRVLRSLDQLNLWKASEWKLWMILSSSILDGFLPPPHLKHLALLTNFLSILLHDENDVDDLRLCEDLVNNFCNLIPTLYGPDFFLFNVHILHHAVERVRDWGPLWGYSLFQFENYNNVLVNSYSGTSKVGEQIVHRTIRSEEVYSQSESCFKNDYAKSFCDYLIDHQKLFVKSKKLKNCTMVGPFKHYHLSLDDKKLLKLASLPLEGNAYSFNSLFAKKNLFKAKNKSTKAGCDYIVLCGSNFYQIENIISIYNYDDGILFARRIFVTPDNYGIPKFKFKVSSYHLSPLRILEPKNLGSCKVTCITTQDGQLVNLCPLVNCIELE